MEKKLFISLELSKIAKEKGFKEPCLACYDKCDMLSTYSGSLFKPKNYNNSGYCKSAPLYDEIIDWFNIKHNIDIVVMPKYKDLGKFYGGYIQRDSDSINKSYGSNFKTRKEALDKAIEDAFKLIDNI